MPLTIEGFINDFGKTVGLVHKAMVMGRKVGAGARFWTAIADNEELFRLAVQLVRDFPRVEIDLPAGASFKSILEKAGWWEHGQMHGTTAEGWVKTHSRVPIHGPRTVEMVDLSEFAYSLTITSANEYLAKMGYRGAYPEEMAAIGKQRSVDVADEINLIAPGKPIELGYDENRQLNPDEDKFLAITNLITKVNTMDRVLSTVKRSGETGIIGWKVNTKYYRFAAVRTTKLPVFER